MPETKKLKSRKGPYRRILLKLSGEALMGQNEYGIDSVTALRIAREIKELRDKGTEVCLVVGGGNIFRGVNGGEHGIDRPTGDYMGMLATVMNALAMQSTLETVGVETRVQSAIPMSSICEPYIRRRAMRHLKKGRVVIFAAGTGNPFFTTDSAAVLRASEMNCEILLKGTKVNGVYTSDPQKNPKARRFKHVGYADILKDKLNVMDMSAIALARDNHLPLIVFSIAEEGSLLNVMRGKGDYTLVSEEENAHYA